MVRQGPEINVDEILQSMPFQLLFVSGIRYLSLPPPRRLSQGGQFATGECSSRTRMKWTAPHWRSWQISLQDPHSHVLFPLCIILLLTIPGPVPTMSLKCAGICLLKILFTNSSCRSPSGRPSNPANLANPARSIHIDSPSGAMSLPVTIEIPDPLTP